MKGRVAGAQPPSASTSRSTPSPPDRGARLAPSPMDRGARPSAFAKLYYFMRPDRALMLASLALACLGEVCGIIREFYIIRHWLCEPIHRRSEERV